jgi:hypothetical protein
MRVKKVSIFLLKIFLPALMAAESWKVRAGLALHNLSFENVEAY